MAEQDKTIMCFTRWLLIQTKCLTHTWRGVGWELCLLWRVKTNTSSLTRALPWVCFTRSCSRTYVFTLCLDWIISSLVSLYHTPVPRTRTSPSHTHTHTHTHFLAKVDQEYSSTSGSISPFHIQLKHLFRKAIWTRHKPSVAGEINCPFLFSTSLQFCSSSIVPSCI